ncbi:salicylate 1-monooxygenase-like protein [Phanerochaete sordida]|uniref:Salicylate 1-monooxygenase-like protein n=1 Tax=Phanerochaete sordida TaxID=48140 RepID=A0A9P3G3D5_9APHY|nr:salicylate 1-monooxygenase-like protein [Phanerochaete sordida]
MGRLTIAICGGGIGGLCLAVVLKKFVDSKDIVIDLYEAGPKFAETGAGITAWERTRSILRTLGMADAFDQRALSFPVIFRKSDTTEPFSFHEFSVPKGSVSLPRNEMLNILVEQLALEAPSFLRTHFSKRLVSYEQDLDGVTLRFEDNSTARADVLVGAEGIGSPTRKTMYADLAQRARTHDAIRAEELLKASQPTWTGTYAYRALLDREKLRQAAPDNMMLDKTVIWFGKGRHVVSYPISPVTINVVFLDTNPDGLDQVHSGPPMAPSSKQTVAYIFQNFEEDIRAAIQNADEVSRWAVSHIRRLPQYADGRVALLGDSAHAMSPHFAAGAGQAIEDAYILGRLLAHPTVQHAHIPAVLEIYDTVRRPIAADAVERSLRLGGMYELQADCLPAGVDADKLWAGDEHELAALAEAMQEMHRFHWETMPEREWERAERMLEEVAGRA